ncbi:Lrp/AsnC family transcriptional regulator [Prauserella flavalba]|uniref:Lrp/AsnC family transcriptional regulator n=1 Tax=Prauserella flavalba TaxID=1477506 RepID=UPI00143DDA57|nr:AsnC family transcriptional regulator [Prauserella flavalba]
MPPTTPAALDELDRRIVAALHVDGRATWRRIAAVLGQPERTVARRGNQLLEQGHVVIHGMADPRRLGRGEQYLLRATCEPKASWSVTAAIARRTETVFAHLLFGTADLVADIWCPPHRVTALFLQELAAIPGIARIDTLPVLRYVTTLHDWDFGALTQEEVAALREIPSASPWPAPGSPVNLPKQDRMLITALAEDGRRSYDELGRLCGLSEQTAKRRVEAMRRDGLVAIRAVTDPAAVGLPVGAIVWIQSRPDRVETIAAELAAAPYVRYAAVLIGDYQLVADIRLPDKQALQEVLAGAPWTRHARYLQTSLIIDSLKQSDILSGVLHS